MIKVDLNADLGESFGAYTIGCDAEIMKYITSANIACGWHAGDAMVMARTVKTATAAGIALGSHPGYPDLMGFGRRNMVISPAEMKAYIQYQTGALLAFCREAGVPLQHIKPHGAMYNTAGKSPELARAVCEAVAAFDDSVVLLALSGSEMVKAAREAGIRCASEVFADRAYEEDGSLVARSKPGAVIADEELALKRVIRMVKEGVVTAVTGKDIPIKADSICVHGDNPKALAFVQRIRAELTAAGVTLAPIGEIA